MAASKDGEERRDKQCHYRRAALQHPLRRQILRLMLDGTAASAGEIAAEVAEPPARVFYHLRILLRREALKATARGRPAPALYRWSSQARWVREMLGDDGA